MHSVNTKTRITALALCVTMLAACTERDGSPARGVMNGGNPNKQDIGTVVGVVGGGVLGSAIGGGTGRVAATIIGGLLGGALGNMIGKSLDDADMAAYNQASQRALQTGHTRTWHNPDTGHSGTVVPHKHYTDSDGRYCREYTQTIVVDGKKHTARGNACRESDGTWKIVE